MLLGLNGQKRSGKDTIAEYLQQQNQNVEIYKFALPIKYGCLVELSKYGYTFEDLDGQDGFDREENIFSRNEVLEVLLSACEYCKIELTWNDLYFIMLDFPGDKFSIRFMLQIFGTDVARAVDKDFWIHYAQSKYIETITSKPETLFIITDVRFPNEVEFITNNNGSIIQVHRDGALGSDHESDNALSDIKNATHIDNNGSLEELYLKVDKIGLI